MKTFGSFMLLFLVILILIFAAFEKMTEHEILVFNTALMITYILYKLFKEE